MRIGFFTDTFLPQRNGVVTSILSFGPELVKKGHEVFVFCPQSNVKEYRGMVVRSYPSVTFRPYPEFKIAIPRDSGDLPKLDSIHTHGPFSLGVFGLRVAKKQGVHPVSTFHTMLSEYVRYLSRFGRGVLRRITWRYCRLYYNRCHKIITPSNALKMILLQHQIKKPIAVVPTGIDLNFFKPIEKKKAKKKLGIDDAQVFLTLGRLGFEKNIDVVLQAFKDVNAKLIIAGRGPAERKLKNLRKKLGLQKKVSFEGYVPEKLKPTYYSAADAFVIASTSETQAVVVAEAMSCGTPVMGANSLAIPEIVSDGKNGYLFGPGNVEQLSKILKSYRPSKKMRTHALKTGQKFSLQQCTDKLEKFYKSLL
ncbi:Alpha-monoglucosyldiacylglycerol synthase [subsurface metagenome]